MTNGRLRVAGMRAGWRGSRGRLQTLNPADSLHGDSEMLTLVFNPLRRWWYAAFAPAEPVLPATMPRVFKRREPQGRPRRLLAHMGMAARPLTPFGVGSRGVARRFWITVDPQDKRRAALGGSFAEVCAALEGLAAEEAGRGG